VHTLQVFFELIQATALNDLLLLNIIFFSSYVFLTYQLKGNNDE